MKILIIEDEKEISEFVKKGLEAESFIADVASDGEQGLKYVLVNNYDLILLDMGLPKLGGLSVARNIRDAHIDVPIIVLTVDLTTEVKVQMLSLCDDYVTKPFSIDELIARVHAVLRRGTSMQSDVIEVADLSLDVLRCAVTRGGKSIKLRNKEFALLEFLMRNEGFVLSREKLLEKVWGMNIDPFTNTVDVHIRYLRQKIDEGFGKKLIQTVSGRGYKIEAA